MRKSTLFISAALTAFMLAVLFGVVSAYQNIVGSNEATVALESPPMEAMPVVELAPPPTEEIPTQIPAPAEPVNITPEEAASIASSVIGRTDLYSVELTQFEGADVYLVTFSSGDLVYVSLQGQVVSISKLPVTVITKSGGGGGGGGGGGNKGGGEREDHDEHEGGDDD